MKKLKVSAKSHGKEVGSIEVKQYDSCAEAIKDVGEEAKVVAMINQKIVLNAQANLRRTSGAPSMARIISKASPEAKAKIEKILKEANLM